METKRCSICKKERPLSEFYKDKSKKSGYKSACKLCMSKSKLYDSAGILTTIRSARRTIEHLSNKIDRLEKQYNHASKLWASAVLEINALRETIKLANEFTGKNR